MKRIFTLLIAFIYCGLSFGQTEIKDSTSKDASFPGGESALAKFIKDNLIIPNDCTENPEDGIVYVRFLVEKDGKVSTIEIDSTEAICKSYVTEAIRLVRLMPTWEPGIINGDTVTIFYTLPIYFANTELSEVEESKTPNEPNWVGFEFGINQFMNSDFNSSFSQNKYWENQTDRSWNFNYNFFEYKVPIYKQFLGLTTGLGYSAKGFSFRNNYQLSHSSDTIFAIEMPTEFKRNKLTCHYLTLPLLIEFATKKDTYKNFYISAGIIGYWKFSSYTFQKGTEPNGDNFSHYTYSNFNLNRLSLEGTIRFGYSYVGVFAGYQLTPFFQKNKTVPVFPFRVGLSINVDYYQE